MIEPSDIYRIDRFEAPLLKQKTIKLSDLQVNSANDRHGDLITEDAAIEELLQNNATHMRNLTKDIVASREVYELPLVRKTGTKYTVYDGNRRTTALKLLADPQKSPTQEWAKFFQDQRNRWGDDFITAVDCQIEDDLERLDAILYRRHTGSQAGVGQSPWDQVAKRNFERRTGKYDRIDIGEEVEELLRQHGELDDEDKIKRSNLNRLLSSEKFWNRVGLAVEDSKVVLTHKQDVVLKSLSRIAHDLLSGTIVLKDIWSNADKTAYLDKLDRKNILPKPADTLTKKRVPTKPKGSKPKEAKKKKSNARKSRPKADRNTLIRNIDLGISETQSNRRALDIIDELQHDLQFGSHDNAIAVLFRVLIEISIDAYLDAKGRALVNVNDNLAKRFSKVHTHMFANDLIDKKYHQALKKFEQMEPIFSAHTLNAYVHNPNFFPSDHHLKSMWDTVEVFIVQCLTAAKK
ncbi:MAG: hypothetical protein AAGH41_02760 [Pseudomonadota bacterium]